MKLIGMLTSPYTRRVAISLSELGVAFEHVPVSVFSDYVEFRAVNPAVRAPTLLLDDGTMFTDSHVILEHFDRLAGDGSLWPSDQGSRSRSAASLGLAQTACDKAVQLVYERELRPTDKQYPDWADRVTDQVRSACELLDAGIEPEALWLAPGRPTQAGLSLAVACTFMQHRIPDIWSDGQYARLQAFRAEAEALAVFRAWPHASLSKPLAQSPLCP